jgi:hypothetical protein
MIEDGEDDSVIIDNLRATKYCLPEVNGVEKGERSNILLSTPNDVKKPGDRQQTQIAENGQFVLK